MPFFTPADSIGEELILVLAFGTPSYMEACCLFGERATVSRSQCEDIALVALNTKSSAYTRLAGVHKVAIPIPSSDSPDFIKSIEFPDKNFNFSLSLYCPGTDAESKYDALAAELLSAIREAGLKKANLVRSRFGSELHSDNVRSRSAIDFVVFPQEGKSRWGVTVYVSETEDFKARSKERPFVNSGISLSPRLAHLLVNVAGLSKGSVLLDPFCGSGTILGEALLGGINCIGIDRNHGRVEQTKRNLSWLASQTENKTSYSVLAGDATQLERSLGNRQVDAIVSEPILLPRLSSTPALEKAKRLVRNASEIYSEAIYSMSRVVRKSGRVVIVVPSLKTLEGRDVSVTFESLEDVNLKPFQPQGYHFEYPLLIAHQSTRWIKRMLYVLERT